MTEPIKNALTAEEWEQWTRDGMLICYRLAITVRSRGPDPAGGVQHATAALALYDQPFGFKRDDAKYIRWYADRIALPQEFGGFGDDVTELLDLADRIEALLPPEGP
jgi:hypothetical protein